MKPVISLTGKKGSLWREELHCFEQMFRGVCFRHAFVVIVGDILGEMFHSFI